MVVDRIAEHAVWEHNHRIELGRSCQQLVVQDYTSQRICEPIISVDDPSI